MKNYEMIPGNYMIDRPHITYAALCLSVSIMVCFSVFFGLEYKKSADIVNKEIEQIKLEQKNIELKLMENGTPLKMDADKPETD